MEHHKPYSELIPAVVLFFVLLFAYTKFIGPIQFGVNSVNSTKTDSFQVQGTGKAAGAPDRAVVTIGVTNDGTSVADAQEKTNQTADKIITALKNLGVAEKDIKTVNYSVTPNFDYSTSRKTGTYTVAENLEVKVPIEKTNQAIDLSTASGANVIGNVTFTLSDDKERTVENQAREEAVKIAKDKADGLAKASGIKLGKIINVSENLSGGRPMPVMMDAKLSVSNAQPSTPTVVSPGEANVEITVTLTYDTF